MITEIKKGDKFICVKTITNDNRDVEFERGNIYTSNEDGGIMINDTLGVRYPLCFVNHFFERYAGQTVSVHAESNDEPLITLPDYYNNSNGSLYKIADQRGWSPYVFDVVKRLDRGGKKDPLRQEIEKSIGVLQLWLKELEG